MIDCYDISEWMPHPWLNTGGTRDKKFIQSPQGEYFFFKTSLLRPNKDYRYEFWNEIIAHHLGQMLGFNTLRYDLAIDRDRVGCLSKTMINNDLEDLNEGGKYLQAFDNSFEPEKKEKRQMYSFQLIEETLVNFKLEKYMDDIIELMVFDSIIGNSDRHQENWAFIIGLDNFGSIGIAHLERLIKYQYEGLPTILKWFLKMYMDKKEKRLKNQFKNVQITLTIPKSFAPIYDNGSSLGRELLEERVILLNREKDALETYINRGKSEIHWRDKKLSHFSLLKHLAEETKYKLVLDRITDRVKNRFEIQQLYQLLDCLDDVLDDKYSFYKLPLPRKELIAKMIDLRVNKLISLKN